MYKCTGEWTLRGQLVGVESVLLPCGFRRLNSGHQVQQQMLYLLNHLTGLNPKLFLKWLENELKVKVMYSVTEGIAQTRICITRV